jgi:hypothetical protein
MRIKIVQIGWLGDHPMPPPFNPSVPASDGFREVMGDILEVRCVCMRKQRLHLPM